MKKIKVTRRPKTQEFTLKPSRLRMILIYLLLFLIALGLGFLIRLLTNPNSFNWADIEKSWIGYAVVLIGGPVLLAAMDYRRWTLRVLNGDQVEGSAGAFGDRMAIDIRDIDWTRTQRSLSSWFKMGNAIYGTPRQRILLNPWFYPPADYREFLDMIGYVKGR